MSYNHTTKYLFGALAVLVIALPLQAQDQEVRAAIDIGNKAYIDAMAEADARAFADVYDTDGRRLAGGGEVVRGRAAIADHIGSFFTRIGPVAASIETAEVWLVDDMAYETGRWSYTFTPPSDNRRTIGGRYVTIWRRQEDGSWKIYVDMSVPGTES